MNLCSQTYRNKDGSNLLVHKLCYKGDESNNNLLQKIKVPIFFKIWGKPGYVVKLTETKMVKTSQYISYVIRGTRDAW